MSCSMVKFIYCELFLGLVTILNSEKSLLQDCIETFQLHQIEKKLFHKVCYKVALRCKYLIGLFYY